jgi:acetyl esterase
MRNWSLRAALLVLVVVGSVASGQTRPERNVAAVGEPHVYKKVDGRDLTLWVVRPEAGSEKKARPAIVFFHGGGWVGGSPGVFNRHAEYFASRGMVAVLVEYRLLKGKGGEPPEVCIRDAKSAMRWVRAHAAELGVDPDRIASAGGSAGGHLAAAVTMLPGVDDPQDDAAVSPKSQAMILFNAVADNGPGEYGYNRVGERYKEFSPAHHISADAPPALVIAGDKDHLIPVATVERFRDEMKKAGVRCDVRIYPGQGHGFFNGRGGNDYYYRATTRDADEFLASRGWIQGPPTLPAATQPTTSP